MRKPTTQPAGTMPRRLRAVGYVRVSTDQQAQEGVSMDAQQVRIRAHCISQEIDLVDIAANWYVDDLPPMMFMKKAPNSHGFVNPRDIEELWRDQFDWVYREMDYAVFPFTIHPDVSGRPQVLLMLERLIEHINKHDGVKWMTFEEIAVDFRKRFPFGAGKRPEVI